MPTYISNQKQLKLAIPKPQPRHIAIARNGPLELGLTLDRSSSMRHLRDAALCGFNQLLSEQRAESVISSSTFADSVKFVHDRIAGEEMRNLEPADYIPDGNTALLDGIGTMIEHIAKTWDPALAKNPVLIAILTDGFENGSQWFSFDQIFKAIHFRRLTCLWEFLFLCADDAGVAYGLRLGIKRSNIVRFDTTSEEITELLLRVSRAITAFRLGDRNFAQLLLTDKK
jgi:hypothetical protein